MRPTVTENRHCQASLHVAALGPHASGQVVSASFMQRQFDCVPACLALAGVTWARMLFSTHVSGEGCRSPVPVIYASHVPFYKAVSAAELASISGPLPMSHLWLSVLHALYAWTETCSSAEALLP